MMPTLRLFLASSLLAVLPSAFGLTIAGSDLLKPVVEAPLQQFSQQEGVPVTLSLEGSQKGLDAVTSGKAPIALIALPRGEQPPADLESTPWAFLVTSVVVHRDNPVEDMTYNDLIEAFSTEGVAESWEAFTSNSSWSIRKLSLHTVRGNSTVGQEIFKVEVLGERELRAIVRPHDTLATFNRDVRDTFNVLAIMPTTRLPENLRAVPVGRGGTQRSFAPNPQNVLFGDYPLQLPFYLVYRRDFAATAEGKKLLTYLLSDEMAEKLNAADVMPLVESEREDRLRRLQ
ncbi:MAG: hypothetical protein Q7P63_10235 [Verrucomicrobiota bacterium JB022]|nr:hypothetical protein [Verrucomicrobiota bacterium JB022]